MNWYTHQKNLIDANPSKRLVAFGCGAGKTRTVLQLAANKGGTVLAVMPKTQVLDQTWEREMTATGIRVPLTVLSKEQFKKGAPKADILILDEGHVFLGVSPSTRYRNKIEIPRASQLFEEVVKWVDLNKPKAIYICSATPFPQPLALWAVARLFGFIDWDYFAFRRKFYHYVPNIGRGVWIPKKDRESEDLLRVLALKVGTFGRLQDFFDVPDQVHKDITVGISTEQKKALKELPLLYPEPLARVSKRHQIEQGVFDGEALIEYKTEEIVPLVQEFEKVLIFARYTKQIEALEAAMRKRFKNHLVVTLTGATEDRRAVLMAAEASKKCIVIAQSQISTGYELPSFRCTVFASMSYSFVDYEQALGRTLRANAIAKNLYVYLLSDEVDHAVLKAVKEKRDFNESLFAQSDTK